MTLRSISLGILRRFFCTTINKLHYLKMEIDADKVTEEYAKITIPARELNYDDFLLGDKNIFNDAKLAIYKKRFSSGKYKAYGVMIDGKLAYSCWISLEKVGMPIETETVLLKSYEGYLEDDYCAVEFRGRGIHTQMLWFRLNELLKKGKKVAVITIMDGNMPALKPALKCGFKDMYTFYCGLIFGKKYNTIKRNF